MLSCEETRVGDGEQSTKNKKKKKKTMSLTGEVDRVWGPSIYMSSPILGIREDDENKKRRLDDGWCSWNRHRIVLVLGRCLPQSTDQRCRNR